MRRVLFLTLIIFLSVTFSACRNGAQIDESTSMTDISSTETTVERTAPAAGTDMSVDEIVDLYNKAIKTASNVTRLYSHAEYKNLELSSEMFESAAKSVLDNEIKNNDTEYTATQRSEIEEILPKPCLDKSLIKKYSNSDGKISLQLYDVENPTDSGCVKFYPIDFLTDLLEANNISADDMKMSYTDCRIDFTVDENKAVTDLSYSWCVHASGNFELLLKTQSFGIDICVEESYKFRV